jgi:hypothetical protein
MKTYTINSECGLATIEAATIDDARDQYERGFHYDFAGAAAGEYPGSWYWIEAEGTRVEDCTADMP